MNNPDTTPIKNTALTSSSLLKAVAAATPTSTVPSASGSNFFSAVSSVTGAAKNDKSDRRNSYRCPCNLTCNIGMEISIRDISMGGAALVLPFSIPLGTPLTLNLPSHETLLHGLKATVVSCGTGPAGMGYEIHLKFETYSTPVQKTLVRFLMELQTKRSRR